MPLEWSTRAPILCGTQYVVDYPTERYTKKKIQISCHQKLSLHFLQNTNTNKEHWCNLIWINVIITLLMFPQNHLRYTWYRCLYFSDILTRLTCLHKNHKNEFLQGSTCARENEHTYTHTYSEQGLVRKSSCFILMWMFYVHKSISRWPQNKDSLNCLSICPNPCFLFLRATANKES